MQEQLYKILREFQSEGEILPETDLQTGLNMDSFSMIQLIIELEDTFQIKVLERDYSEFTKVADIIEYLERKS